MNHSTKKRLDEVDQYYKPITTLASVGSCFFWVIAALSLLMPYTTSFGTPSNRTVFQAIFIVLVLVHFTLSQILRFYLVPRAESMRRKHLLSDAFGTPLSHDRTCLYYNNHFHHSVQRLGANTMENAYFSKEIAAAMLRRRRIVIGGYLVAWLLAFSLRHSDVTVLTWVTQLVFSGQIIVQWLNLEVLHLRHEHVYDKLHTYFLHEVGEDSQRAIASVLDAFVSYESAKSSAGLMLSTNVFQKLNPSLSEKWNRIRKELKMDFQPVVAPDAQNDALR